MNHTFYVFGKPVPQGSKTARVITKKDTGKTIAIIHDVSGQRLKDWRKIVSVTASNSYKGEPLTGAVRFTLYIYVPRPKSHYGTGKNARVLKENAPKYPLGVPDRTKLLRAIEDGLKGIMWMDDSQVIAGDCLKLYAPFPEQAGCRIRVEDIV